MAKKSRNRDGRATNVSSSRPRLHVSPSVQTPRLVTRSVFLDRVILPPPSPIEDGRVWHPEGDARPSYDTAMRPNPRIVLRDRPRTAPKAHLYTKTSKRPVRALKRDVKRHLHTAAIRAFEKPLSVYVCIKRKIRKEVFHALRKAGRGGMRKPRYSLNSHISCR